MATSEQQNFLKNAAETIKVSAEAILAVSQVLDEFARSVIVEINNTSTRKLTVASTHHDHGDFRDLPGTVAPGTSAFFTSKSGGLATGTTGEVVYSLGEGTAWRVRWIHPFIGTVEANSEFVGGPGESWYVDSAQNGGGNTAHVRFMIGDLAASAPRQADWRTCGKCKTLFFGPDVGNSNCAAGGTHEIAGWNIRLPHDVAGPDRQDEWRYCHKCTSLFFNGYPNAKGVCAQVSPPSHQGAGLIFDLPVNAAEDGVHPHQDQWRFCEKCLGLFYGPHNQDGDCSAGGQHLSQAFANYNYVLPFDRPEDANHQSGWQTCGKCKLMVFGPHNSDSDCPAGGHHEPVGFVFQLPHSHPGAGRESNWQTCGKCKSLFFNGWNDRKGLCAEASLAAHEPAGLNFNLAHDMPGIVPGQSEWKFCTRCNGLVFEPHSVDGDCPAGGPHVLQGYNFILEFSN